MGFNAIQLGEWSTRLRRALGLRGDLGATLAGPAAMPIVRVFDAADPAYEDDPHQWGWGGTFSAGAGNYAQLEVIAAPSGITTVEYAEQVSGSVSYAYIARGVAPTAGGTILPAYKLNFSPLDAAPVGGKVNSPVTINNAPTAVAPVTNATWAFGTYQPFTGFCRLLPGDKLIIEGSTAAATVIYNVRGRWFLTDA